MKNMRRELESMPFDRVFYTSNGRELCHATGFEVFLDGRWWDEFVGSDGEFYYG